MEAAPAMREMKYVWKEMKRRGEEDEDRPLKGPKGNTWLSDPAAMNETDFLDTGFTLREIGPQAVRVWLVLQAVGLALQFLLWREVSGHLAEFEALRLDTLFCGRHFEQVLVGALAPRCVRGPHVELLVLGGHRAGGLLFNVEADGGCAGGSWRRAHSWEFTTVSSPPTFLVLVHPVSKAKQGQAEPDPAPQDLATLTSELKSTRWSLEIKRLNPPTAGPALQKMHSGPEAVTVEDLSLEARQAMAASGRVQWRATLNSLASGKDSIRFVAFVEDADMPHLAEIRASPQCSFGTSWKAFNMQNQGHRHKALLWCRFLLGLFLLVGGAAVWFVHTEIAGPRPAANPHRFHMLVVVKFILQDVPQQLCIVLYLFGWYEAYGLRCQLCLFDPGHCSAEEPFHFVNLAALGCTLLSSVANQLLIRPVVKKAYTEDDICVQYFVRVCGFCLAVLPVTSGFCWASRSLIPMPRLIHALCILPCSVGWLTVAGLLCLPLIEWCDEDCDA